MVCHSSAKIRRRRSKAYEKETICLSVILSKKHLKICHSSAKIRRKRNKAYVKRNNLSFCLSVILSKKNKQKNKTIPSKLLLLTTKCLKYESI